MESQIQRWLGAATAVVVLVGGVAGIAFGQEKYPTKAITIVAPYGTGGSIVTGARLATTAMQEKLGVPVAVTSVPGPNGWNQIYRAAPDGYTIGVGDMVGEYAGNLMNPMPYDVKEFEVLGAFNSALTLVGAGAQSGVDSFDDLAAAGKEGKTLRYSSFGFSAALVQMTLLSQRLDFDMAQVVFGSARETILPIVRGDADFGALGTWMLLDQVQSGEIKPILLWSTESDPRMTDVPNLETVGLADLAPVMSHRVVFAPPGTPEDIQNMLTETLEEIFSSESMKKQLEELNLETNARWGEEFRAILAESYAAIDQNKEAILEQAK